MYIPVFVVINGIKLKLVMFAKARLYDLKKSIPWKPLVDIIQEQF